MLKAKEIEISYKRGNSVKRDRLTTSGDIFDFALKFYDENIIDYRELCYVILMNNNLRPNGWYKVSEGGLNETLVDPRMILQAALLSNSSVIILVHNHPSGAVRPSRDDDRLTERVRKVCDIMKIKLLDHVIVSTDGFYSYNDEGRL
ncbi:MAG: JAB domain-containing protein [Paludibacteraceae bacterium]|nr:JAB domain-containing protein [Paludibacteraceae bacterium]